MTKPATAAQLAVLVQQEQTDEAAQYEDATAVKADGGADAALAAVLAGALAGWVTAFGAVTAVGAGATLASYLAGVREDAARATRGLGPRATRAIERSLADAAGMGVRHTLHFADRAGARWIPHGLPAPSASGEALDAARALAATVREQLALMDRLLTPGHVRTSGWQGVLLGLSAGRRAALMVRQVAAWCIHQAINDGARQAIRALTAGQLWVAEATACVRCAAYAGRIADADDMFPGGLSFDPNARNVRAARIDGPPLHINCRCRLVPWRDEWAGAGLTLPDLLREQAWRAVVTGDARPSESRAARLRAARTLITLPDVPPRLRHQARTVVAAGHF